MPTTADACGAGSSPGSCDRLCPGDSLNRWLHALTPGAGSLSGTFDVWIGLVEVRPLPGNDMLAGDPGAFANALTIAGDAEGLKHPRCKLLFRGEGFEVVSVESVERLRGSRARDFALPEEMAELGDAARATSDNQFGHVLHVSIRG